MSGEERGVYVEFVAAEMRRWEARAVATVATKSCVVLAAMVRVRQHGPGSWRTVVIEIGFCRRLSVDQSDVLPSRGAYSIQSMYGALRLACGSRH